MATSKIPNQKQIIFEEYKFPNTGSIAGGSSKTITVEKPIKTGYSLKALIPAYSGDDQFVFVASSRSETEITCTIRNVSSVADSGTPSVVLIWEKI